MQSKMSNEQLMPLARLLLDNYDDIKAYIRSHPEDYQAFLQQQAQKEHDNPKKRRNSKKLAHDGA